MADRPAPRDGLRDGPSPVPQPLSVAEHQRIVFQRFLAYQGDAFSNFGGTLPSQYGGAPAATAAAASFAGGNAIAAEIFAPRHRRREGRLPGSSGVRSP